MNARAICVCYLILLMVTHGIICFLTRHYTIGWGSEIPLNELKFWLCKRAPDPSLSTPVSNSTQHTLVSPISGFYQCTRRHRRWRKLEYPVVGLVPLEWFWISPVASASPSRHLKVKRAKIRMYLFLENISISLQGKMKSCPWDTTGVGMGTQSNRASNNAGFAVPVLALQ